MKFSAPQKEFAAALSYIRGTLTNSKIPILQNALLSVELEHLTLGSNNTYACMTYAIECDASENGVTTVPLDALYQIVNGAPKKEIIKCSVTDSRITVTWGKSKYTLPTLPASDYPAMHNKPDVPAIELSEDAIEQLFSRPASVIDGADERPLYSGIFIHDRDGSLASIASDGARVLCFGTEIPSSTLPSIMVAKASAAEIAKIGAGSLTWTDKLLFMSAGPKTFSTNLIEAKYGDYLDKIPKDDTPYLEFDRVEFLQAMERLAIVAVGSSIVRLHWGSKPSTAIAEFAKDGDGREEINCTGTVPKGFVGLPAGRVAELVSVLRGEKIRLHIKSNGVPIRIVDLSEPGAIVCQCPLVLSEAREAA